jgi:hypothetical protein
MKAQEKKVQVIECARKLYTDWTYTELMAIYPRSILDVAYEMVDLMDNELPHLSLNQAYDWIVDVEKS